MATLRPVLARHKGLVFLDRYASLSEPDLLLSYQLWENEEAIIAWRTDATHRKSQAAGRRVHFADYRIRVGSRVLHWCADAPRFSAAELAALDVPHVLALYGTEAIGSLDFATFESVNYQGRFIALMTLNGYSAAVTVLNGQTGGQGMEEAAIYGIRRDYRQFDRAQAPTWP